MVITAKPTGLVTRIEENSKLALGSSQSLLSTVGGVVIGLRFASVFPRPGKSVFCEVLDTHRDDDTQRLLHLVWTPHESVPRGWSLPPDPASFPLCGDSALTTGVGRLDFPLHTSGTWNDPATETADSTRTFPTILQDDEFLS